MTDVSGPELVVAACANGVIGTFPTHNAGTVPVLETWLDRIRAGLSAESSAGQPPAPVGANVIVHRSNSRLHDDIAALIRGGVDLVIASVGSPKDVVGPLHAAGIVVYADVASMRHVDLAIATGVDGLVLLTAGAGGQTGWANPFAFVRAVRERFEGTIVLAGGVSDGAGVLAAQVLGADLVYLGTRFIATEESLAPTDYKAALVAAGLDDVTTTTQVSGLAANVLSSWVDRLGDAPTAGFAQDQLLARRNVWAAGHSVAGSNDIVGVAELVDRLVREYVHAAEHRHSPLFPATASRRF
jgi:nitronate monooxygenase